MMAFLRGKRADLHVPTTVGGVQREFFNEREIAHMVDVQHLFLAAIAIPRICAVIILLSIALLWRTKADIKRLLPRMLCIGTALFFALTAALAAIISTDFTKYFILFHKIFFTNDLWILDPSTDLLINIVGTIFCGYRFQMVSLLQRQPSCCSPYVFFFIRRTPEKQP